MQCKYCDKSCGFENTSDKIEKLIRDTINSAGIPFHTGSGFFNLLKSFLIFGKLEIKFHDMPADQNIKVSLKTGTVSVDIVCAQIIKQPENNFQTDKQSSKCNKPVYIPVTDNLIDD